MPSFTDRATRSLKHTKSDKPKMGVGIPDYNDGYEGETRIQMVEGNPRLYLKTGAGWFFTGLVQDGAIPDVPTATSTRLGVIKIGDGGTVASDGTYTATAATPAADDFTAGDDAVNITTSSGNITIDAAANNSDIIFKGTDNTSDITMLTLDGSEAGNAIFNANVTVGALLIMPDVTNHKILVSDGTSYQEVAMSGDATIANTGAITLAAAQTNITSIYATDLIIGEDSQTAIDFGTANEIDFKINNSTELTLSATALYPVTDAGLDLGTSSLEFKDAYFDGTVTSDAFAGPLTGDVTGNVSGNAGTVTVSTVSTDATHYLCFVDGTSGAQDIEVRNGVSVNPSTDVVTVAGIVIGDSGITVGDNVDIGSYEFRAQTLKSDVGIGTAPLVVTSTTVVSNLNADKLDGADLVDEDNMSSNSATKVPTQQSVKAYVDSSASMGDGFKIADSDSNVDVTEGEYVKFTTQQGSGGVGVVTGAGTSGDPHLVTLNYADTNTTYSAGTGLTLSGTSFSVNASQTQITAVGTIATGTWQGTTVAVDQGGTGQTSVTNFKNVLDDEFWTFSEKITADAGIDIDNINIDGTTIALSSGNLTLDAAGDIYLDAGGADIVLLDDSTHLGTIKLSSSAFRFDSQVSDQDITFTGNDGGSAITALTLDMSDAGTATFNSNIVIAATKRIYLDGGSTVSYTPLTLPTPPYV